MTVEDLDVAKSGFWMKISMEEGLTCVPSLGPRKPPEVMDSESEEASKLLNMHLPRAAARCASAGV